MKRPPKYPLLFVLAFAANAFLAGLANAEELGLSVEIQGRPLSHWVAQANSENGPQDLDTTVNALIEALKNDDPNGKRVAADALAVLGPKAIAALPVLLEQFNHDFPWVRESCQDAAGSMGKAALPALIDLFEKTPGGPRIRAAFVLGGMGEAAKEAVPVLLRVMEEESDVMAKRILGVLGQIDPEAYGPKGAKGKASYDASAGAKDSGGGDWGLGAVPWSGARRDLPRERSSAGMARGRSQTPVDPGRTWAGLLDHRHRRWPLLHHGRPGRRQRG